MAGISDEVAKEILRNIALGGSAMKENAEVNIVLGSRNNLVVIMDNSSGLPKIRKQAATKFTLILRQPERLEVMNAFEIRCCLCKKVISYPAWYWSKKYAVNHFHYFICFDSNSPLKPTTKCYKRA